MGTHDYTVSIGGSIGALVASLGQWEALYFNVSMLDFLSFTSILKILRRFFHKNKNNIVQNNYFTRNHVFTYISFLIRNMKNSQKFFPESIYQGSYPMK